MLTEIEWWGGLLIIWMGFFYALGFKESSGESKFDSGTLVMTVVYLSAIAVLAAYFYDLESPLIQFIYTGLVVVGALTTIALYYLTSSELAATEKDVDAQEEEGSFALELVLMFFPLVVSFGLASYKALTFFDVIAV